MSEMISLDTIEKEIIELEKKDTSYAVCERLAWLYIIRSQFKKEKEIELSTEGGTVLKDILNNTKNIKGVINILSDHIDALQIINPNAYEKLIKRLENV